MTYNVFAGTLNLAQSINPPLSADIPVITVPFRHNANCRRYQEATKAGLTHSSGRLELGSSLAHWSNNSGRCCVWCMPCNKELGVAYRGNRTRFARLRMHGLKH